MKQIMISCPNHQQQLVMFMNVKNIQQHESRLACQQCTIEHGNTDDFCNLYDVINKPEVVLKKIRGNDLKWRNVINLFTFASFDIENIKKRLITQINKLVDDLIKNIQLSFDSLGTIQQQLLEVKTQFLESMGQQRLVEVLESMSEQDDQDNFDEWATRNENITEYIEQFKKINETQLFTTVTKQEENIIQFTKQIANLEANILEKWKDQIAIEVQKQQKILMSCLSVHYFKDSSIINSFQYELLKKLSNPQQYYKKFELIYQGTKDGLSTNSFYNKCHNKKNLLIICKSQNGYVFGGYSPCEWVKGATSSSEDPTNSSFLFNCTLRQIYPIKRGCKAIQNHPNQAPCFGQNDFVLMGINFKEGTSNLGYSYSIDDYDIPDKKSHLMGGYNSLLVEMEVFKIQ